MIEPGLYRVIKVDERSVHLPQGRMPEVGDIVTVDSKACNHWHNGTGDWCWAYIGDEYGAHFHESHLCPAPRPGTGVDVSESAEAQKGN